MFTFGIFTTHLPYIAFVIFYAGLMIFGGEKSSAENNFNGEDFISKVIAASDGVYNDLSGAEYDADFFSDDIFISARKIYLAGISYTPCTITIPYKETNFQYSWFSRPPPVV